MNFEHEPTQLSEYLLFKNGKLPPERLDSAPIPVFGSNGLIGYSESSNSDGNTIIIGRVGSYCGSVHFSKEPCWVSDNAIICLSKNPSDSLFWFYFLTFADLNQHRSGSGQPLLNQGTLNSINCKVPQELDVRVRIGNHLASYDKKSHINYEINIALKNMVQSIFQSWFVDFEPVKAKVDTLACGGSAEDALSAAMQIMSGKNCEQLQLFKQEKPEQYNHLRTTASLFPAKMNDSENGLIPEGWNVRTLSSVIEIIGGGTPKRSEEKYWNGDISWFSVKDIPYSGDVFVIETEEKITELGLNKSSTKLLPVGTTIITARGTVGKLALVGHPMCMNQSCYGIRGVGVGDYFTHFNVRQAITTLLRNTHGAVFDTITTGTFDTYSFPFCGVDLANRFEDAVAPLMKKIKNNVYQNQRLKQLKETLLPQLLTGKLQIPEASMDEFNFSD